MNSSFNSVADSSFNQQVLLLDDISKLRVQNQTIVRIVDTQEENVLPPFASMGSPKVLYLSDFVSNYKKGIVLDRVFDPVSAPSEISKHFDYLAYTVANGGNAVLCNIGGGNKTETFFGREEIGLAYVLMDHTYLISQELPGERSYSIRMLEVNENGYFDLLSDDYKVEVDSSRLLEQLTEIPVDGVQLVSEWVEQGMNFVTQDISLAVNQKYKEDSMIVLYFIIESIKADRVATSTFMFIDFPDIKYTFSNKNHPIYKAFHGDLSSEEPMVTSIFKQDLQKAFIFNINESITKAPETMKTMYLAGCLGRCYEWKIASHINTKKVRKEIREKQNKCLQQIKDFSGLYPALRKELYNSRDFLKIEADNEKIDRIVSQEIQPKLDKKAKMQHDIDDLHKSIKNSDIQLQLAISKFNSKNQDFNSRNYFQQEYLDTKDQITAVKQNLKEIYNRIKFTTTILKRYKSSYNLKTIIKEVEAPFNDMK